MRLRYARYATRYASSAIIYYLDAASAQACAGAQRVRSATVIATPFDILPPRPRLMRATGYTTWRMRDDYYAMSYHGAARRAAASRHDMLLVARLLFVIFT